MRADKQSLLQTHIVMTNRFIVHADDKLTAFMKLQRAIHQFAVDLIS
jgi:hypothetical protein